MKKSNLDNLQAGSSIQNQQRLQPKYKTQQTRTLKILQLNQDYTQLAQKYLTDLCINIGTSIPDQVQFRNNQNYIRFPSVQVAKTLYEHLKGQIQIQNNKYKLIYYPIRRIDLTLSYDWYCDKCDYKNFSRRAICYRCQAQKSLSCRLSYSTQPTGRNFRQQTPINCSLMVRGSVLMQIDQQTLLQAFQEIVPVRDVRQIKNKLTGKFKDFAFVQFFSAQQTSRAYKQTNQGNFKIGGQKVTVVYSRSKGEEEISKPISLYQSRNEKKKLKNQIQDNYYHRQRQRQIQQQKARPSITMEQLKQKRQQQMKKLIQNQPKQMNEEQTKRKQAEMLAKQWQKQMKSQITMYICPVCSRKFSNIEQMKVHQKMSKLHIYHMQNLKNLKQN